MKISGLQYKLATIIDADRSGYRPSKIYDWFMCAVIILSIVPLMFSYNNTVLDIISWLTVTIFLIDFILRCYISPFDKYKIGKPWWCRYPFTIMGLIDIASIIPVVSLINPKLSFFKFFRLARLIAIMKYARYSYMDDILLRVLKRNRAVLRTITCLIILYIFISALLIFNVEPQINPETGQKTFSSFFDAIYWSVVTLTTVGYGDIYPVTLLGKVISVSLMICGVGLIATTSSIITAGLIEEINNKTNNIKNG